MTPLLKIYCAYALVSDSVPMLRSSRWRHNTSNKVLDGGADKYLSRLGLCQRAWEVWGSIRWTVREKRSLREALRNYGRDNDIVVAQADAIERKLLKAIEGKGFTVAELYLEFTDYTE